MLEHLDPSVAETEFIKEAVTRSMESLVLNYSTINETEAQGLLKHGSYHVRGNASPDDYMIWGDYYNLEALLRIYE
ncbi:hypothetical protein [Paenibacillus sp.]|uniref:hypothetical protein n=1 Tax=Paenibacillus sp. TaxID=58172 RepID=UPI0028ADF68D|nr:hypothetical protein [Paenibacillus sp.]